MTDEEPVPAGGDTATTSGSAQSVSSVDTAPAARGGPSPIAAIRAISHAERAQFDYRHTSTRRKKALVYVLFAAMLPVFALLLWGAYGIGQRVGAGEADGLLELARWYLPAAVAMYVFVGATEATKRLVGFEARELLLTTVSERTLVLGLLVADFRQSMWGFIGPTALLVAVFAIGAGSPTVVVAATIAALSLAVASMLAGYLLGLGARLALRRAGLSSTLRSLAGGLGGVGVVVLSAAGGVLVGRTGANVSFGDQASFAAITPDGPPPIPLAYYADLFFVGTPLVDTPPLLALASGVLVVATVPVSLWLLVALTPRLWYAESPAPADDTDATVSQTPPTDGREWPWLEYPVGYVADRTVRRSVRTPQRLAHLLYYAAAVGMLVVMGLADPALPFVSVVGGALVCLGIWLAGGTVGLNPLGDEGAMLEQLVLAELSPASFVRARVLAGTVIALPFVLVGTALLAVYTLSPTDALLVGGFLTLLTPASAAMAVGVGSLLPKTEPGRVLERIDARPPEKLAMLAHGAVTVVLAAGGSTLLVVDATPSVRLGGLAVVALATVVAADSGYRFAVSALADYGRPRRPDPIYALELAVGLALLGLVLSVTVTEGVVLLAPVSGSGAFLVAFVAGFVGWAVAGVAFVLAAGYGRDALDIRLPTARDGRYLVGGVVSSVAVYGAVVAAVSVLDAPVVEHAIVEEVLAGGPAFVLALFVLVLLVNAPVEEFLFRNVIQNRLARTIPTGWAIAVTAVVFALVHLPVYASADPVAVAVTLTPLAVLAAIWGWVYSRTENLVVPTLCHGVYNVVSLGLLYALL
ncbi:type II CAAX endopeptidase family protein [Natronobiforma cellulositropha]|uniref:type II CAAX endopeptidase family protein n=1 Tax=Natronobiforma cellulositropha TaxID=1679076 RepID=UPI0021D5B392|nr:type II CAAX endopeptidase family protein [Natronobiforma cellulositropha]